MKYSIFVDGTPKEVFEARTSAFPYNRVWQGKQRDLSQTEISYFSTFDMDSPVTLTVDVRDCDVKSVEIRPREYEIPFKVDENTITVTLDKPRKFTVEVNGYAEALHIFANEPCSFEKPNDNTRYFGKGVHHEGLIIPKDNETIIIDEGAIVYGMIYAYKVKNVKILGRGILDGAFCKRGNECRIEDDEILSQMRRMGLTDNDIKYSSLINAYECENFIVDGIVLRDAQLWTMIIRNNCEKVIINNVKIIGQWRYNADGIDICASSNVTVSDCFVRAFDDCMVVRGSFLDGEKDGCSNVVVKDNVLWCDWGKNLEIWSGNIDSAIRNVLFEDNHIIRVCHKAVSIDTWFGSENITVENVTYRNTSVDVSGEPLYPMMQKEDDAVYNPDKSQSPMAAIVCFNVGKLGKSLGNQMCDPNFDTSSFRIAYKNIVVENLKVYGGRKMFSLVDTSKLSDYGPFEFVECDLGNVTFK